MHLLATLLLACAFATTGLAQASPLTLTSPGERLAVTFALADDGRLTYALAAPDGPAYVEASGLGLRTTAGDLVAGLTPGEPTRATGRATYELASGKQLSVDKPYASLALPLTRDGDSAAAATLEARVFDDGLALRYVLGDAFGVSPLVTADLTEFALPAGLTAWRQPYDAVTRYSPGYEQYFDRVDVSAPDTTGRGYVMPLYAYDDQRHVLLHEGAVAGDFFGSHLGNDGATYHVRGPLPAEARGLHDTLGRVGVDRATPWRLVVAGPSPGVVAASTLVTDVAPARAGGDFAWVTPGRAAWSWWSARDSPVDYGEQARFVDFAAEQGWEYVLVDANWQRMGGGGTFADLAAYAKTKNVGLLAWYNSGGPHNVITEQPRDRMLTPAARRAEMARMSALGLAGIKVDFFQSDKAAVMAQYGDILADAAEAGLVVNFHGCTVPRGLRRRFPNLLTMEAVRGAETYIFSEAYPARAPRQHTVLPLSRNAVGPLDYTPVTFTDRQYPRVTTDAHELALAVLFESGIQHFADDVDAYRALPDYALAYLNEVPVAWDELRYLGGEPGEWIALARRRGDDWYLAAVNGADAAREIELDVSALGDEPMTLIEDAGERAIERRTVAGGSTLALRLLPYGGVVGVPGR